MADERDYLHAEVEALRYANEALEAQLLVTTEQSDQMLSEVESQRNSLRTANTRQRSLGAFVQRVMDTAGCLLIVLGPDGSILEANRRCDVELRGGAKALMHQVLDSLLPEEERHALQAGLRPLPWPVLSPLYETIRCQGQYTAEHRMAGPDGHYQSYLIQASTLHSPQGREEGAVVSATNITLLKQQEARLLRSEWRFKEAQQLAQIGSWEEELREDQVTWSEEVFRIVEADPARDKPGRALLLARVHPEDLPALADSSAGQRDLDRVFRLRMPDQRTKWVHERSATEFAADGTPLRRFGTLQDVTVQKLAEAAQRLSASVFENSLNGILITSTEGVILHINLAFTQITGYTAAEAIGRTPRLVRSELHDPAFYEAIWSDLRRFGRWQGEIHNRHKDGHVITVWQSISMVRDENGQPTHYVGIFNDISDQKQFASHIQRLAHYDVLTELPNRVLFSERCSAALESARRGGRSLALLFLDLDRFKHVNDSLGHPVGDALLKAVAGRLRHHLRTEDTVARLGGDEFVIILEGNADPQQVELVARKLIRAFNEDFMVQGHRLNVGLSVGISLFPRDGGDVTTLVKNADLALYRAKEQGRGRVHFFEERLTKAAHVRLQTENELRTALIDGQLFVQYQPQYRLRDGHLAGAEALVRWRHPKRGIVPPDQFIPIAEDTGLVVPIGELVLATACQQAKAWIDDGMPLEHIAVNVSGVQLQRSDFVATVRNVLARTGLPGERLELEITETYIMKEAEQDVRVLDALRALGVRLSIDDFGTGHSSLAYLKRLPVDRLKVDRAFIRDTPHDHDDAAITRAIVAMAHSLRLKVVAEGIETPAQVAFLRRVKCETGQGFLFARPMDAAEFAERHRLQPDGHPELLRRTRRSASRPEPPQAGQLE